MHQNDIRQLWLHHARTGEECLQAAGALSSFPDDWIDWAEKIATRIEADGKVLSSPLGYRLTIILNGFILLQESKFICDIVENSFRMIVAKQVQSLSLTTGEVSKSIPGWKSLKNRLERERELELGDKSEFPNKVLLELTFHQVVIIIYQNWRRIYARCGTQTGFKLYFSRDQRYQDSNKFLSDATYVRKFRNKVAHSNRLFQSSETQKLYRVSSNLVASQNGNLNERVLNYRRSRPRFLESVVTT